MKAVLHTRYGPPDELTIGEVPTPVPADNELLIRVHATSVSTGDCNARNFTFAPKVFTPMARLVFGVRRPRYRVLGTEFAGEVVSVGRAVTRFAVGDRVFGTPGMKLGAHAEYLCLPEDGVIAPIPETMPYEDAAGSVFGGHTALYFLRDLGNIQPGQHILIYGASGSIGTAAIQLAKYYGANVTGVCSTANVELVRSLGADTVLDYTRDDFTQSDQPYDIIFETVGKTSYAQWKQVLAPNGVYLVAFFELRELMQMLGTSFGSGKRVRGGMAPERVEDILFLKDRLADGSLRPVIDRTWPLEEIVEAYRYVETGHKKGNVVITVDHTH